MQTKTITFYQCDICHKDYDTAAEATACEASHGTLAIERARYGALQTAENFPIEVVITDGTRNALYTFLKIYRTENS